MDFFSGLKKAYDSLGEEITKTFDSSQTGEDGGTTSPREEGDLSSSSTAITTAVPRSPEPAASGTIAVGDQSSVYATPSAVSQQQNVPQHTDEDGGWGQWENQPLMSPARKTKIVRTGCIFIHVGLEVPKHHNTALRIENPTAQSCTLCPKSYCGTQSK